MPQQQQQQEVSSSEQRAGQRLVPLWLWSGVLAASACGADAALSAGAAPPVGRGSAPHAERRPGGGRPLLANAVVLFLDSDRKPLVGSPRRSGGRSALRVLQKSFLHCYPYPVHVLKEQPTPEWHAAVQRLTTSPVTFTNVSALFQELPHGLTPNVTTFWVDVLARGEGHHLGYRLMCRLFAGLFVRDPALRRFDYYWRLDTDSWVDFPPRRDPLMLMASTPCVYGHHGRLHRDSPSVTHRLLETTLDWAAAYGVPQSNVSRMLRIVRQRPGALPMFYNNFEIASTRLLLSDAYQSLFSYADGTDGFFKSRWGDAPFRTLGVLMLTAERERCDLADTVSYHHGDWGRTRARAGSESDWGAPGHCPAAQMPKSPAGVYLREPAPVFAPTDTKAAPIGPDPEWQYPAVPVSAWISTATALACWRIAVSTDNAAAADYTAESSC